MSRPASPSAALPIAYAVLRLLVVLNWLMAAVIVILLLAMPNEQWIMAAFKLSPSPDAERLVLALHGTIGRSVSTPAHPVHLDAGFSINGWLAVLLTFLLARVFAEGTRMRDDLEGTV